jgi:hypothetical protein
MGAAVCATSSCRLAAHVERFVVDDDISERNDQIRKWRRGDVSTISDGRVNVPPDPLDFGMTSGELVVPGNGDHE